ncbi:protein of unknown function [Tepidibacter aestuarii]|nr:protein of unknown function [Tepidibacter aestuarii]
MKTIIREINVIKEKDPAAKGTGGWVGNDKIVAI